MKSGQIISLFMILSVISWGNLWTATNEECLMCHSDPELSTERRGVTISLYVDEKEYSQTVHKNQDCIGCYPDADVEEFPHLERPAAVNCVNCHSDAEEEFNAGIHGMALKRGAPYPPTCPECHGKHDILPATNIESRTYKMNIPLLCGKCHREDAPVARIYNISEKDIISNYTESIHGEGLFKQGLIVTATCNDCHGNHLVLPHTNPRSTISAANIARTCMKCHARIEQDQFTTEVTDQCGSCYKEFSETYLQTMHGKTYSLGYLQAAKCSDCHGVYNIRSINDPESADKTIREIATTWFI